MIIIKIVVIAITSAALIVLLRNENKEYAMFIALTSGIVIFSYLIGFITPVIDVINTYSSKANLNTLHIKAIFKIIATAYIAQFGSDICKDYGSSSIASKIELSAKVMIIYFSLPIIMSLFEFIGEML